MIRTLLTPRIVHLAAPTEIVMRPKARTFEGPQWGRGECEARCTEPLEVSGAVDSSSFIEGLVDRAAHVTCIFCRISVCRANLII